MKEVFGNAWDYPANVFCITTNGTVKSSDGAGVMGRGIAAEAKKRFPGIDKKLGNMICKHGNHVYLATDFGSGDLCFFPVKHNWWEKADLNLIKRSAMELASIAEAFPETIFVLPRPGCGNGGLCWDLVKPVIEKILPDNVHVITFTTS